MGTTFCTPMQDDDIKSDNQELASYAKQNLLNKNSKQNKFEIKKTSVLPGQCLISQTFDLEKDLKKLEIKYGNKYSSLLKRNLMNLNRKNLDNDLISNNSIKIMQFNILADGLSCAYRWNFTKRTFIGIEPECLQWTYRGIKLVEEITRFNPDIICLQECDQIDFLMKYLSMFGYKSYFQQKTTSPVRHEQRELNEERKLNNNEFKMNYDGVAIIYKENKFKIIDDESNHIQYIDMKNNKEKLTALAVPFEFNDNKFLLITTHLKATKSLLGEQKRENQINLLFNKLIKNDNNLAMILCSDLNANPIKNTKGYDPLCYNTITDSLGFKSVYKLANGVEPDYTTWKIRKHGIDKHVLDYIFIKNINAVITQILDIPNKSIPNWYYPSDHFSIMAQITFL